MILLYECARCGNATPDAEPVTVIRWPGRPLKQEDIDAVYGECDMQDAVWCLTHHRGGPPDAARCDAWWDCKDLVERVIDRLKEER